MACAVMREIASVGPPAAAGTMTFIGRVGYSCAAAAPSMDASTTAIASRRIVVPPVGLVLVLMISAIIGPPIRSHPDGLGGMFPLVAFGAKRTCRVRRWVYRPVANAPEPTSRGLKFRSAAVCCRTEVCYAFGRRRGAGSVLPPIQVWPRQRGDRMKASTILLSIFALLATPLACAAQQPGKTPRIGYVR